MSKTHGWLATLLTGCFFAFLPGSSAEETKPAATPAERPSLNASKVLKPANVAKVDQALGLAAAVLERERLLIKEEKRRLENLKEEVKIEMNRLRDLISSVKQDLNKERQNRIAGIAKSISAMTPQGAATALANLNSALAVELLTSMKGKTAGKILEAMDARKAASLLEAVVGKDTPGSSPKDKVKDQ